MTTDFVASGLFCHSSTACSLRGSFSFIGKYSISPCFKSFNDIWTASKCSNSSGRIGVNSPSSEPKSPRACAIS